MSESEMLLNRYLRALVKTLVRREKTRFELCNLIGCSRAEAAHIWRTYQ
jgi:hypothetical protein